MIIRQLSAPLYGRDKITITLPEGWDATDPQIDCFVRQSNLVATDLIVQNGRTLVFVLRPQLDPKAVLLTSDNVDTTIQCDHVRNPTSIRDAVTDAEIFTSTPDDVIKDATNKATVPAIIPGALLVCLILILMQCLLNCVYNPCRQVQLLC